MRHTLARLASDLLLWTGMALAARKTSTEDALAEALLAAELGEPTGVRLDVPTVRELFESIGELRVSVPYAALRLLERLAEDARVDVRVGVARNLGWFADVYGERVEELLARLGGDGSRKVRTAAREELALVQRSLPALLGT